MKEEEFFYNNETFLSQVDTMSISSYNKLTENKIKSEFIRRRAFHVA